MASVDLERKQNIFAETAEKESHDEFLAKLPSIDVRDGEYELKLLMVHSRYMVCLPGRNSVHLTCGI